MHLVRTAQKRKGKTVVLIKGGPGTGKSLIAMNLIGALSKGGFNVHYATGSKAFTETLRNVIGPRGSSQFKYFNSYGSSALNAVDRLVFDEAHRMRTGATMRSSCKRIVSHCAPAQAVPASARRRKALI